MTITMVPASELVEDFDLYPRGDVDASHVSSLVQALAAGAELPPIVACRKTKRIVDGFHRRRAFIQAGGENAEVAVIYKTYKTDADLYREAMEANAAHGRRLTPIDFARATAKARALGMDDVMIAKCLNLTVERVGELVVDRMARCGQLNIPLKQTIRHVAGRNLTKAQVSANKSLSGMSQSFYANQLIILIESNLLNTEDEKLMARLGHLHGLLDELLTAK